MNDDNVLKLSGRMIDTSRPQYASPTRLNIEDIVPILRKFKPEECLLIASVPNADGHHAMYRVSVQLSHMLSVNHYNPGSPHWCCDKSTLERIALILKPRGMLFTVGAEIGEYHAIISPNSNVIDATALKTMVEGSFETPLGAAFSSVLVSTELDSNDKMSVGVIEFLTQEQCMEYDCDEQSSDWSWPLGVVTEETFREVSLGYALGVVGSLDEEEWAFRRLPAIK